MTEVRSTIEDVYSGYGGGAVTVGSLASAPHCHSMFPSYLGPGCENETAYVSINISGTSSDAECFDNSAMFNCTPSVDTDGALHASCVGSNVSGTVCGMHTMIQPMVCSTINTSPGPRGPMRVDIRPALDIHDDFGTYIACDAANVSDFDVGNSTVSCNMSSSGIVSPYCTFDVNVDDGMVA